MVFDERPSPARVSAAAAAKLPRAVLLALIVAYIVTGLFGRDPWQEDDATGFGVMWTMARSGEWLLPNVAGALVPADGPLAFWAGGIAIAVLGDAIGDVAAARLTVLLWFLVATAALWYAVLRLARREEAQPVAFAFGGEASSRDYGRMLADVAVLLALGTLGPVLSLHETTSVPAAFALSCATVFGLTISLERPQLGATLAGLSLGLLFLARGLQPALWFAIAALPLVAGTSPARVRAWAAVTTLALTLLVPGAWLAAVVSVHGDPGVFFLGDWMRTGAENFAWPAVDSLLWLVRALPWYSWPLWPLAAWALYAWRHGLRHPHIAFAATLLAAHVAGLLVTKSPNASDVVFLVVPLVLLAAFGAVSLRRAVENAMDWFAITAFSLFSLALWVYFFALHAGFPPKMHTSVLRQTIGYVPPPNWGLIAVAAAATGFWLALVVWRVRQPAGALWRGPMLAATGLVALWVTFAALFQAAVDHRRSFAPLARAAAEQIARSATPRACVLANHLRPSHLAVFAFHGGIRFAGPSDLDCPYALHRDLADSLLDDTPPAGRWIEVWRGNRPGRADEVIRLYRRATD